MERISRITAIAALSIMAAVGSTANAWAQDSAAQKAAPSQHVKELMNMLNKGAVNPRQANIKPVTVSGEVVEIWCYTSETMGPGKGKEHRQCASLCAAGGVPLAIVDENGEIYIAAKSGAPYKGCLEILGKYISKKVKVSGFIAVKKGVRVLKITSVEELSNKLKK